MARFEIEINGGLCNAYHFFEGSENGLWTWMKEEFDNIGRFSVKKMDNKNSVQKWWVGSMKNGRISKELLMDFTKEVA